MTQELAGQAADVVVVGAGAAGLSAAVAAAERGARVVVLEAGAAAVAGGNTRWSVGISRVAHGDRQGLEALLEPGTLPADVFVPAYDAAAFVRDVQTVARGEADVILAQTVAAASLDLLTWWRAHGVRYDVAPFRFGRHRAGDAPGLPSGAGLMVSGGGARLLEVLSTAAGAGGVDILPAHRVTEIARRDGGGFAVHVTGAGGALRIDAPALVLACGGFAGSPAARARYLGPDWDLAKSRASTATTGVLLEQMLELGAQAAGQWSGAHAVATAPEGPARPDARAGDRYGRYAYPYGITVDADGHRFFDEGAGPKNLTYSTIGAAIHARPGHRAFQIFDRRGAGLLEPRYESSAGVEAASIDALAEALDIPADPLKRTVRDFNAACPDPDGFDPHDLDGLRASPAGQPVKSNWALPITEGPFVAYPVVPSVTFMFAGLKIDGNARILDTEGAPIPGAWACGDAVGGLAVHGLPAGTGMVSAGVWGRIAGTEAARSAE
jgi:tricarballylate dehydrogenase